MIVVHAANIQDRDGAKLLLEKAKGEISATATDLGRWRLCRCRRLSKDRLSKDYEEFPESSEAMAHIAMIQLMARRLSASPPHRDSVSKTGS